MTNSEKYLKDDVSVEELTDEFEMWHCFNGDVKGYGEALYRFLQEKENVKPTLTEDERVILRNIDKTYTHISRTYGDIWVGVGEETADTECKRVCVFNHLFQFIKERRRILY